MPKKELLDILPPTSDSSDSSDSLAQPASPLEGEIERGLPPVPPVPPVPYFFDFLGLQFVFLCLKRTAINQNNQKNAIEREKVGTCSRPCEHEHFI